MREVPVSARGRKKKDAPATEVAEFEFYPTPREAIETLIASPWLKLPGGTWLDPCAGTGRIPSVVNSLRSDVAWTMVEIDARHEPTLTAIARDVDALHIENFLAIAPGSAAADVLIMNPPFSHALDFVMHGMSMAPTVIMLQRLNWLGPARAEWLRRNQPDVYVLPKRPSFTADGSTDATEYAWFVWGEWGDHGDGRSFGRIAMLDGAPLQPSLFGGAS